jgi:transposase
MRKDKISAVLTRGSRETMEPPSIVEKILHLSSQGWGKRRIAKELGISPNTVKHYRRKGKWLPYEVPKRTRKLEELGGWIEEMFFLHRGNAEVVRQELLRQHHIQANLRTVERAVKPFRERAFASAKATVRFETPPGKQMQIDFGSITVKIAGEPKRIYFFAAVLGFSRRQYIRPCVHERQSAWFEGLEGAFHHFSGITQEVLLDNPKALVISHNPQTREVVFNERLHTFANYWRFKPKACAPYRARTKGKDENTVKYFKHNAIAGREFSSWEALEEHIIWWMRDISDVRIHGTTGERPIDRFQREEAASLQPLNGKPPFHLGREVRRLVHTDACIELDTNFYSVPWHLIKAEVNAQLSETEVRILYKDEEVALHPICIGERQRSINPQHLKGIVGAKWGMKTLDITTQVKPAELLRPLAEYEAVAGGGWL